MAMFGSGRPNVKRLRRKDKVAQLRDAAGYQERHADRDGRVRDAGVPVRLAALKALAHYEGEPVTEAVRAAVADQNPGVRAAAVRLAAQVGATDTADALIDGLASWPEPPFDEARAAAADTLVAWAPPELAQRFALALTVSTDYELARDRDEALLASFASGHTQQGRESIAQRLTERLGAQDTPDAERDRAAELLRWIGPVATVPVRRLLRERDPDLRAIALAGDLLDNALLDDLVLLCDHHDPSRRAAAAAAVGAIQDTRGVGALLRLTQDEAHAVRSAALAALDRFGVSGVVFGIAAGAGPALGTGQPPAALEAEIAGPSDPRHDDG